MKKPTITQIKQARAKAGLTQQQAGDLVYVNRDTWLKWESGRREINLACFELFQLKTGLIKLKPII